MNFPDFLQQRTAGEPLPTEDVLTCFLPLLREVIDAHRAGFVAPLEGLQLLHVDDHRIWFDEASRQRPRSQPAEIQRVVVLAHRRSALGTVRNPTVLALTSPGDLLTLVGNSASRLSRGQRAAIGALIRRDHEFHGRHRRAGTRPPR